MIVGEYYKFNQYIVKVTDCTQTATKLFFMVDGFEAWYSHSLYSYILSSAKLMSDADLLAARLQNKYD